VESRRKQRWSPRVQQSRVCGKRNGRGSRRMRTVAAGGARPAGAAAASRGGNSSSSVQAGAVAACCQAQQQRAGGRAGAACNHAYERLRERALKPTDMRNSNGSREDQRFSNWLMGPNRKDGQQARASGRVLRGRRPSASKAL
jgi:hypothetical protein